MELNTMQDLCTQIRRDIVRMVNIAASGHPGGSMGCVEYFVALYGKLLKHNPKQYTMDGKDEDIFILSNGHISPVYYSTLARFGYLPAKELASFRKINSRLQGHPCVKSGVKGIRIASGSLGQGLSVAIGAAQTKKLNKENNLIYSLHGDGELQEGQIWEAVMYAAANKVDNIIATIDYNKKQIDGPIDEVLDLGDLAQKWHAFGWYVIEVQNGNTLTDVINGLKKAKAETGKGKPVVVLLHTKMGYGVDFMTDDHKWHGVPLNDEQLNNALKQLNETIGDF